MGSAGDCRLCEQQPSCMKVIDHDKMILGQRKRRDHRIHESKSLKLYDEREEEIGEEMMREFEKVVVLRAVDSKWMDHIDAMDQLRQGIHLRAYGGTDPLREYQFEGFEMFQEMIENIQEEVATYIMKAHVESNLERQAVAEGQAVDQRSGEAGGQKRPVKREEQRRPQRSVSMRQRQEIQAVPRTSKEQR